MQTGSLEKCVIDHVEPAQNAVDDRPEDRVVVGIGDRDGERRAKAHAVLRALDPNPVVSISVHGDPFGSGGLVAQPIKRWNVLFCTNKRMAEHSAPNGWSQCVGKKTRSLTGVCLRAPEYDTADIRCGHRLISSGRLAWRCTVACGNLFRSRSS